MKTLRTFSALFFAAAALAACGGGGEATLDFDTNPGFTSPGSDAGASDTPNSFCGYPAKLQSLTGLVTKVHDGDTITIDGQSIRLDGIDAPELKQAYGPQSRDTLAALVLGQSVTVAYDAKDKYARILGTVFKTDCTQVNALQVRSGAAWYYEAYKCDLTPDARTLYSDAQSVARYNARGLWAQPDAIAPWFYRNGVEAKVPVSCKND